MIHPQKPPTFAAPRTRRGHRSRLRTILALAAGVAVALGSGVASTPAQAVESYFCSDNTQPYVPVATVEAYSAGEAVTGLSVTRGTTPEAFSGTYVGFLADALGSGKDLLLFRLSSDVIDGTSTTRGAGIWAGMSGSPVYDRDGRLIGAVAYALTTENLPIAGVTPAEYMKSIGSTGFTSAGKIAATQQNLKVSAAGVKLAGANLAGTSLTQIKTVNVAGPAGKTANAFVNRTLARTPAGGGVASFLRSKTFQAAGVTRPSAVPSTLVAGGTVAALYSSGDLIAGGIGTVTAICGNSVWAFGHPMAFQGKSSMLMANASTALIVPDSAGLIGSYKQVSQIGAPIGMVTEDRLVGIKGTIGTTKAFPIAVAVQNAAGKKIATYRLNVSEPSVSPAAAATMIGQATYEQFDQYASGSAHISWTINYTRVDGSAESLTNSQFVNDDDYLADVIGVGPADDLSALISNRFEDVTVTGVNVTLKLLSADSISYQTKDVQVKLKGKWTSLDGARLKAGTTYSFRPVYTVIKNGRAGKSITGALVKPKISKKATKRGSFVVAATTQPEPECTISADGTDCPELSFDPGEDAVSFDDLVGMLALDPGNQVDGTLSYKLKKGSTIRSFSWTTPGVVAGDTEVRFTIKR